jgi:hypothetical protein
MEQLAGEALKQYPLLAIPLLAVGVIVHWFLAHIRWMQGNQNELLERLAESFERNAEMLGRVAADLDRSEAQERELQRGTKP